jgi:hypothetical protein
VTSLCPITSALQALGVFKLAHFQFSQTLNSRTGQSVAMCPPGSDDQDSLRVFTRSPRICSTCPPQSDGYVLLQGSGLQDLKLQPFSLKTFLSGACDLSTHVSHGSTTTIPSGLQTLEISNFKLVWPHWLLSEVMDPVTRGSRQING